MKGFTEGYIRKYGSMFLPAVLFLAFSACFVCAAEKNVSGLKIKKIKYLGKGVEKVKVPGVRDTVSIIGSSMEKVYTVKVKNESREDKDGVKVVLTAYDKKGGLIESYYAQNLNAKYAKDGYLYSQKLLSKRKTVELYFAVSKETKGVKAELYYGDDVVETKIIPASFKKKIKEEKSSD